MYSLINNLLNIPVLKICIRNFILTNILLKKAASKGLTLYDIGQILYREDTDCTSKIQKIVE